MYGDPTKIRSHVVKIRLSDEEHALLDALVAYTGEQKAVVARSMVMDRVMEILAETNEPMKDAFQAHCRASRGAK